MIGQYVRKKQERWVRKYFFLIMSKPQFSGILSSSQMEKVVSFTVAFNQFVMGVAFFLALITVFMKYILVSLEFEKTVVLLLVIIMWVLRSLSEKLSRSE